MDNKKSIMFIVILLLVSMLIAGLWDSFPVIKSIGHAILDPTAGRLLKWNLDSGMIIIIFIITLVTTLFQKYGTDQASIKELKKKQKEMQEEMKKNSGDAKKMMELQKEQFAIMPQMMSLTMKPMVYTMIPLLILFRWFYDYFNVIGDYKFFGVLGWFWLYLIGSIILSMILRKVFKVE